MARILIVDDNRENRKLFHLILERAGHHVNEAANGREALNIIHQDMPDLLFTDLSMPIMNGDELIHILRHDPATTHLIIIIFSVTYAVSHVIALAEATNVHYILPWGATPAEIRNIVTAALEHRPVPFPSPEMFPHLRLSTLVQNIKDYVTKKKCIS